MKMLTSVLCALSMATVCASMADAAQSGSRTAAPVIAAPIDNTHLVTLKGNVRVDLSAEHDLGPVEDSLPLRLYMVLQRSPAQQAALENLIERQQQPTAPEYHQWITPQEFGERFGVSERDIAAISQWLESRGMHVNGVMNNASFIDFSATARDVRETFGAQLHYFDMEGGKHPALVQDPMIPAALGNVVAGIQGLNKIPAHANHTKSGQASWDSATHRWRKAETGSGPGTKPLYSNPDIDGDFDVTPQDFYTIYNVNPIFNAGTKGATATVAVVEETDIVYGTVNSTTHAATGGDVQTFRTLFGVPGTLNMHVYHGYGTVTCNDPGVDPNGNGEQGEAALDAEWASALAPAANLIFMSCDQSVNNGIISSEAALIDNNIADVMSLSYGHSELTFAAAEYTSQDTLFAQAAAQGQSFIVSSGDAGSDAADQNTDGTATSGYNVSAFASSPLVTTAGGTDFIDLVDQLEGGPNQSTYWGAANSANYADALGYVPETAWNSSCANSVLAVYEGYTGAGYCAQPDALGVTAAVVGGTGGFSTHYAVPAYQSGITGYSGTKRAQPDISAFAASDFFGHQLIYCDSHVTAQNCSTPDSFATSGGTSFVAPQFAGVFGLLVNYTGTRQGLLNPALYALAKTQFTNAGTKSACYANGTATNAGVVTAALPASTCTFNDVTSGNNDVPCEAGATNCFANPSADYGMLSLTGSASLTPAYSSTPGYDEVTGIGTLNVSNLFTNWNKAFTSTAKLAASATSITSAQSTTLTATVTGGLPVGFTGQSPAITGTASFKAGTTALGSCTLSSGTCSLSVKGTSLATGANSVTTTFSGSKTYPSSTSSAVTVTVTAATGSTITISSTTLAFGNQLVNTRSASQAVTITNTGTSSVSISSIVLGGTDSALFAMSNGCSASLAASASCSVSVSFAPTTTGAKAAAITLTDSATGSPQTVSLSGTGVAGAGVSLSSTTAAFGTQIVNTESDAQVITLTNNGTASLSIGSIVLSGSGAAQFLYGTTTTCTTIAVNATCTFRMRFYPKVVGAASAAIVITDSAPGSPHSIALTGTAISGASPLTVTPSTLTFTATNAANISPGQVVTINNTSAAAVTLTGISFTGANPGAFGTLSTCYANLPASSSCTAMISFLPTTVGTATGALSVTSSAGNASASLTGTGIATAALTFSSTTVNFATTTHATQSVASVVTVTNSGTTTANFGFLGIGGTNPADFYQFNSCGASLAAGSSCKFYIIFRPAAAASYTATLEMFDNAQTGYQGITLNGTGN